MISQFKKRHGDLQPPGPSAICLSARTLSGLAVAVLSLGGCALQPAYVAPVLSAPSAWSQPSAAAAAQALPKEAFWWRILNDHAINVLTEAALADNPSLLKAITRIDEARATLGLSTADSMPTVGVSGAVTRAQARDSAAQSASATAISNSSSLGTSFSWELDLFGRVRQSVESSQNMLNARTADAAMTRLSLAADVANGVMSLRACENTRRVLAADIASREKTLALTRLRLKTGMVAPVEVARVQSGLSSAHTSLASQVEQCTRQVNSLVALSGKDADYVRSQFNLPNWRADTALLQMPTPPAAIPEMPALVLSQHPNVISAERQLAAAWADIGVARANRLPRIDLAAALTGQWISAASSTIDYTTWSIGPSLSGTLFDGGAGAANVQSADARYRSALAELQKTLRSTAEDVENALAYQASAKARVAFNNDGIKAALRTLQATETQWRAGMVSALELEDSRRQYASTQDGEITARRDQVQAWIALVKATAGAILQTETASK